MKRKWHHPEAPDTGKRYFRGVGELQDTPQFREWLGREFPQGAAEMNDPEEASVSRRNFIRLMGASTALAGFGMAGCRRPEAYLVPYTKAVEWVIPGKPLLYATAMPRAFGSTPLVAVTHEGRPTHLQNNPLHPSSSGVDQQAQASILDLYDPERSRDFLKDGKKVSRAEFDAALAELKAGLGEGTAFLVGAGTSPTRERLIKRLQERHAGVRVFEYEAISDASLVAATEAAFGAGVRQVPNFAKAKRIVSLDCDFLGTDQLGGASARDFSRGRRVDSAEDAKSMNRLYSLEGRWTLTGGMADHRLRVPASQILKAAKKLAQLVGAGEAASAVPGEFASDRPDVDAFFEKMAEDLKSANGAALVVAGPGQSPAVHQLAIAINQALGAFGSTIDLVETGSPALPSIWELAKAIRAGSIKNLIITTAADPAYSAPGDLGFAELVKGEVDGVSKVPNIIHLGTRHLCATARLADWHIPAAHYLESWGDVRAADGTYSVIQPMILPLYGGLSEIDLLLALCENDAEKEARLADAKKREETAAMMAEAGEPAPPEPPLPAMGEVRASFDEIAGGSDDAKWNNCLRDGFLAGTGYPKAQATVNAANVADMMKGLKETAAPTQAAMEVQFAADYKIFDGRWVNNGWLQEAPEPIAKITWDNAALISIKTAKNLGVEKEGQMVRVTVNGQTLELPAVRIPGIADNVVVIALGYGQKECGKAGTGTGFDANPLRSLDSPFIATGAVVEAMGETYELAMTGEHWAMEGRAIVREGTAEMFEKNEAFAQTQGMDSHIPPNISIYKPEGRNGEPHLDPSMTQWGMTIDLNSCTGCNACLTACQSENNIPIVGKEQVMNFRDMHWIRLDRYFAVDLDGHFEKEGNKVNDDNVDDPEMVVQPVACQQCEMAPCETVCPVNATVHSPDGLNVMAYNRCIGTRYCANNCPYKARRFNFFDYNKRDPLIEGNLMKGPLGERHDNDARVLQRNPNVTVRMRGVMEKCTYCVQRLQTAKIKAKQDGRDANNPQPKPDSVKVACQIACPSEAIEFGDVRENSGSAVRKLKDSGRNYQLLKYVGAEPRTSYLARLKNPNPALLAASEFERKKVGQATASMH